MDPAAEKRMKKQHNEKYDRIIAQMGGLDVAGRLLPVSIEEIREALENGDEHLNSIALYKWYQAAGLIGGVLMSYRLTGPAGLSLAERVCTLKRAAIRLAQGEKMKLKKEER